MLKLPFTLPGANRFNPGVVTTTTTVDTGGYDVLVGGYGFRLATDTQFPYERATEPTTARRFDSSLEPGEQTLSPLPWTKSQSSFHAGAGQLNLEQGFTAFQYQQEQVEHIRFDTSLGVDCWTPNIVQRLPDTHYFNFGFSSTCMATATVGGVDYAIVGGSGSLLQFAWLSGPDANPTVTEIDLTGVTFNGASNCNITSVATDGTNYFALVQLVALAPSGDPGTLTYVVSGPVTSVGAPTVLFSCAANSAGPARTNLCTNPSFETSTAGWTSGIHTLTSDATRAESGSKSGLATWATDPPHNVGVTIQFATTPGRVYTASCYVWVPTSSPNVQIMLSNISSTGPTSSPSNTNNTWQRLSVSFTASASTSQFGISHSTASTSGQQCWFDDVLIEDGGLLGTYFDGATSAGGGYSYAWTGMAQLSTSTALASGTTINVPGVVGWSKQRLIAGLANSVYELPTAGVGSYQPLPVPKYTHPTSSCTYTSISESPTGVLVSPLVGRQSSVVELTLDTSGAVPTLSGGTSIAVLPPGEVVESMDSYLASFIGVGTTAGVRVGTFDTYTGAFKLSPLSLTTTAPVYGITGRDRFIYAGFTNQQADGHTGLAVIDLSMVVDAAGRNAFAPSLRPPTTAPTGLGTVTAVGLLPQSNRLVFITPEGVHVEGNGPGSDGVAWLRTSRIRYDTAELKLFKLGRVHGNLASASIQVTGIVPYGANQNLGTFGFLTGQDPGEFRLPTGLNEWIQLEFTLEGSTCQLNSYQAKAYPAPHRQHLITFTVNLFRNEVDKFGLEVTDPQLPRLRLQNVQDLEAIGDEITFTEFTNQGPVSELVIIDALAYESYSRPSIDDDFGGYITFKLRSTEA